MSCVCVLEERIVGGVVEEKRKCSEEEKEKKIEMYEKGRNVNTLPYLTLP